MSRSGSRWVVALALALSFTLAAKHTALAQHSPGDEGTGGAAGYSPPIDEQPEAASPMNAPPAADDSGGEPPPEPEGAAPPEDTPPDGSGTDAGTGADQPD